MIEDIYLISFCITYSTIGSVARALLGIYKAYSTTVDFRLDGRRLFVEICASILLGTFGVVILSGLNGFNYELRVAAMIGGFLGADIANLITKKIGLTKGLSTIRITREQVELSEFNIRQISALKYLKTHKTITNSVYQKLNNVPIYTARRDLEKLVKKGKVKRIWKGRYTYYKLI